MRIKKYRGFYVLRIEKGEEIVDAIKRFAKKSKIKGAFLFGLGVGEKLTLGYFDAQKKSYIKKEFNHEYEFTSFAGNISYFEKELVVHIHVTITDDNFNAFGGHLFEGYVPATLEIVVINLYGSLKRFSDELTGLKLLNL